MSIPNFLNEKFTDEKGNLTPSWQLVLSQLLTHLQKNIGPEGLVTPSQSSQIISALTKSDNGTFIYDSTNHKIMVNINGTFKEITTS